MVITAPLHPVFSAREVTASGDGRVFKRQQPQRHGGRLRRSSSPTTTKWRHRILTQWQHWKIGEWKMADGVDVGSEEGVPEYRNGNFDLFFLFNFHVKRVSAFLPRLISGDLSVQRTDLLSTEADFPKTSVVKSYIFRRLCGQELLNN
ncbi:unnamed protein product [Lactuca saligna]|uniref:Uncharacterized protein n=1 Tax=Lactuca saligna TaxID=75948 RepID=A0AA35V9F0_LACSI|nr:unnamed protein product [Lactuca saligna]